MPKKLYLTTLAPVHIGTGNSLEPFDYVILDNVLYRLDVDNIFQQLYDRHPDSVDKVFEWIATTKTQLEKEGNNKKQSQIRKNFTLLNFIRGKVNDTALAQSIQEQLRKDGAGALYSAECIDSSMKKKEVRECVKTALSEVYIPASSLKGSIRTALLAYAVRRLPDRTKEKIAEQLSITLRKQNNPKEIDKVLDKEIFFCVSANQQADAKYDLMKLIRISDSSSRPPKDCLCIFPVDLYLKSGKEPRQEQTPLVEAIKTGETFEVTITIDVDFLRTAARLLSNNDPIFGKALRIGCEEKIHRLFGIDLRSVEKISNQELEDKIIQHLLTVVKEFSDEVKKNEQQWAQVVSSDSRSKFKGAAAKMLEYYRTLPERAMKIGYASGFPATTIFLTMKNDDKLRSVEKALLQELKIGMPRNSNKQGKIAKEFNIEKFPTSRRYVTLSEVPVSPIGWVELSQTPIEKSPVRQQHASTTSPSQPPLPADAVQAVVVEVLGPKLVKVQVMEGKYQSQIHPLSGNIFGNLGIVKDSLIYVSVVEQKGKLQTLKLIRKA